MAVTFDTLSETATIFTELQKDPMWWKQFKSNQSLYIEIRKDNQVNVYFEGGSIARIHYCSKHKKLQIFTHHKYLGIKEETPLYVECSKIIEDQFDTIISNVKSEYSQKKAKEGIIRKEDWSEKYIQSHLINNSKNVHLDSEFAYKDSVSDTRIDLIKVVNGTIVFVELKRLDDGRMLKETDDNPEIVTQMRNYEAFIDRYRNEILSYYQKLYTIKKDLKLDIPDSYPVRVSSSPELLIFNRWEKSNKQRDNHTTRMEKILKREGITYSIIDSL